MAIRQKPPDFIEKRWTLLLGPIVEEKTLRLGKHTDELARIKLRQREKQ
jgi:hypothetical protein